MDLSFKIGLKLYSTNIDLIPEAETLYRDGYFDYVELYIIPGTFKDVASWKDLKVPFLIHAPHSVHGINFAQAEKYETNRRNLTDAQKYADTLGSDIIIVHGGNNGSFSETIKQLKKLDDRRLVLENKPRVGLQGEICVGWSPSEFHEAAHAGVLNGTVLDFGHAICAAASSGIDEMQIIRGFMLFKPELFHIADGEASSESDVHHNFGKGNFKINKLLSFVPENGLVTIETPRNKEDGLNDYIEDINNLRSMSLEHKKA
jgi:deoxyribonuclease-4